MTPLHYSRELRNAAPAIANITTENRYNSNTGGDRGHLQGCSHAETSGFVMYEVGDKKVTGSFCVFAAKLRHVGIKKNHSIIPKNNGGMRGRKKTPRNFGDGYGGLII